LSGEADQLSSELSRSINEFANKVEGFEPYEYLMKKTDEGKCLFLAGNSCSIYELRPLICRFYPFQLKDLGNDSYIFIPTDECPGIDNGPSVDEPFYENLFNQVRRLMKREK
jgi:Fe-S-cluster containining protein